MCVILMVFGLFVFIMVSSIVFDFGRCELVVSCDLNSVLLNVWLMFIILLVECILGLRIGLMVGNLMNGNIVFFMLKYGGLIFFVMFCCVSFWLIIVCVVIFVSGRLVVFDMYGIVCDVCGFIFSM